MRPKCSDKEHKSDEGDDSNEGKGKLEGEGRVAIKYSGKGVKVDLDEVVFIGVKQE